MSDLVSRMIVISNGNKGAANALVDIGLMYGEPTCKEVIDTLDVYEISGTDIYIISSDICGRNPDKMVRLLRATRAGVFPADKLKRMAADQGQSEELTEDEWKAVML